MFLCRTEQENNLMLSCGKTRLILWMSVIGRSAINMMLLLLLLQNPFSFLNIIVGSLFTKKYVLMFALIKYVEI